MCCLVSRCNIKSAIIKIYYYFYNMFKKNTNNNQILTQNINHTLLSNEINSTIISDSPNTSVINAETDNNTIISDSPNTSCVINAETENKTNNDCIINILDSAITSDTIELHQTIDEDDLLFKMIDKKSKIMYII